MKHLTTKQVTRSKNALFAFKTLLIVAAFGFTQTALAQVTIGSAIPPNPDALLDLNEGFGTDSTLSLRGLLLPRVELEATNNPSPMSHHVQGMMVFNLATDGTGDYIVTPGYYFNTGTSWERVRVGNSGMWFYMPSFALDLSDENPDPVDLYALFVERFFPEPLGYLVGSTGAPAAFKVQPGPNDIYYYVTRDRLAIPTIAIDEYGIMTYTVDLTEVTDETYMNIIFVLR